MYEGMAAMPDVETPKDGNAGIADGLYYYPSSIDPMTYTRSSSRTGHWNGIDRANYHILTNSAVRKIVFDGDCAIGFSYVSVNSSSAEERTVLAKKEAILAAGTIHTPQILQLSGIGPEKVLSAANISQKVDLPGVGENFQDHGWWRNTLFNWTFTPPEPSVNTSGDTRTQMTLNLGLITGLPVFAPDKVEELAQSFEAQNAADYLPADIHPHVLAGYQAQKDAFSTIFSEKNAAWMWLILRDVPNFGPANQHHVSRGSVHINVSDPTAMPIIDYRAFSNPIDMAVSIEMLRYIRRYMASDYFKPYGPYEIAPGPNVTTDEQIGGWLRQVYEPSLYHPAGTASKMLRELGGVVDEELLVYGVQRLSVVDASIMPILPGAPTQFTTYAIAEKVSNGGIPSSPVAANVHAKLTTSRLLI